MLKVSQRTRATLRPAQLAFCILIAAAVPRYGFAQQTAPDPAQTQAPAPPAPAQNPPAADASQPPAQTAPQQDAAPPVPQSVASSVAKETKPTTPEAKSESTQPGSISEEDLKQQLVGKQFYLRGGYLSDTLAYDEHGKLTGHSPQGSYTLSVIQIDHVHITKHKVDLEGTRFGLHFNEQLGYEDASSAYDKVRITPKKKVVHISIDREMVVNPKKKKEPSQKELAKEKAKAAKPGAAAPAKSVTTTAAATPPAAGTTPVQPAAPGVPATETATAAAPAQPESTASAAASTTAPPVAATAVSASSAPEPSEADQLKASIAATPEAERLADPNSVTTTTSQAHANQMLRTAIDSILATDLDDRMMAAMPDFWKFYYRSVASKADYRPGDAAVLRQNAVDQKAHLLTSFEPDSNDFAQQAGVAGMALYHTVIGPDGKPGEIAVARPIGFGLDENAVAAIRKAKFSPAIKNGQPVPVMLDLVVQFRIFSKRTGATGPMPDLAKQAAPPPASQEAADKPADAPVLPGPYSVAHH